MNDDLPPLPVIGMTITPWGWGDPLLSGGFMSCVDWAAGQPEILNLFHSDTGHRLESLVTSSAIEKMVDDATGKNQEIVAAWFDWVATNVWGDDSGVIEVDVNPSPAMVEGFKALADKVCEVTHDGRSLHGVSPGLP